MRLDPVSVRNQIETLKIHFPDIWDDGDEQLLLDCLEAETDLNEFLTVLEDRRQDAKAMAAAIDARLDALGARRDRFIRRRDAMKNLMFTLMRAAGIKGKIELPTATLSIRKGNESVAINDEASVPDEFCRIERSPDKTKIKEALKGGAQLNWAALVTGDPSLSIGVK